MQDELERTAESPAISSARIATHARLEMLDVGAAIAAAEVMAGSQVFGLGPGAELGDAERALVEAAAVAEKRERAALVLPAERLASLREPLRRIASARLSMVAHAMAGHGAEELAALTDLGWGVLSASGPEDSFDLTLIARRASEDAAVPFIVVHGLARPSSSAGRAVAMVGVPHEKAVHAFVGIGLAKGDPKPRATIRDRALAERVPFALGAALREYGTVSGRRHDAFDKIPLGESPLVLVGMGPLGDALFCATSELRARGYDVGAIHITSLRPFPGPRLVKALARALAVTVLEPTDDFLAHGSLLARDVKSAFTDALTWAPGFPGIGRIPKLFVGATGPAFDVADLESACANMLADERGRRVFSFADVEQALPRVAHEDTSADAASSKARGPAREISIRVVLEDIGSADAILRMLGASLVAGVGLRTHGIATATPPGAVLDIVASRDHARGGMARRPPRLVVATAQGASSAGAVVSLHEGALLAVLGGDPAAQLPEMARSAVRARRARVCALATTDGDSASLAAVVAGAALAVASRVMKTPLDGAAVARIVAEAEGGPHAEIAGQRAQASFVTTCEALVGPAEGRPVGVA